MATRQMMISAFMIVVSIVLGRLMQHLYVQDNMDLSWLWRGAYQDRPQADHGFARSYVSHV
jgi:hypothetical protein